MPKNTTPVPRFRKFNPTTLPPRRQLGLPIIGISKQGNFRLTKTLVELLKLKDGDRVSLLQDTAEPLDWYIMKDPEGFPLRAKDSEGGMAFSNQQLRQSLLQTIDADALSGSIRVATEPTDLGDGLQAYAILTKSFQTRSK